MKPHTQPESDIMTGELPADANPTVAPSQPQPSGRGRANGKIARLPKTLRDQINEWILDGVSYPEIITRLGPNGVALNPGHFSEWKKRGHQDWLVEQAFISRTRARQETSEDLVRDFDATQVNHAALQLGTLHIFEAFRDLGSGTLNQKLGGDSAAFARLLNALARTSRETLQLQKYREACAQARAALENLRDPKRKLSDDERRAIVRTVDEILGLPSVDYSPATADPPHSSTAIELSTLPHEKAVSSPSPPLEERVGERRSLDPPTLNSMDLPQSSPSSIPISPVAATVPVAVEPGVSPGGTIAPPASDAKDECQTVVRSHGVPISPVAAAVSRTDQLGPAVEPDAPSLTRSHAPAANLPPPTCSLQPPSSTSQPPEFCPRCQTPVPPRTPSGERPFSHCRRLDCGAPLRGPLAPFEHCPLCGVTLPDLLPNGQRAAPNCPECKEPLPPPYNSASP